MNDNPYLSKTMNAPVPQATDPYQNMRSMMQAPGEKPNIFKFMYDFNDKTREKFNDHWFERNDDDIIRGMEQVILSCQRDKYFILKVVDFTVIKDYDDIQNTLRNYYSKKTKNGKKVDNPYDYINLRDSDIMLLKVKYYIKINIPEEKIRIDTRTGNPEKTEGEVEVLIALPRYVNKYYFRIQGNYYNPIYQIVDGSTYNNATSNSKVQSITLKNQFMPIKVYKEYYELKDMCSKEYKRCVLYTSYMFTKKADAMKFILGRYGFYGAQEFLELQDVYMYDINEGPMNPEIYYNFTDRHQRVIVAVLKDVFDRDNMTQSFVYTIIKSLKKFESLNDIYDPRFWNRSLGGDFLSATLDKGIPVLDSFESIYDLKTKESIRLPEEDKMNSYTILRWMMREFNYLRTKDNLDVSTKRPRLADEYLPAVYAMKLSRGIYRISDKGKNVTFKDVVRVIDTSPTYILNNINATNLVDYVNLVNDNDAELALSYTYKGISGLGEQGSGTAVPIIYRSIHPSHLGRIDLDSSSASDPGLSGTICPTAKVYDGAFTDYEEPNTWRGFYNELVDKVHTMHGMVQTIEMQKKMGLSYDYVKEDMVKETIETYRRLIPVFIDLNGKKDYTLGAILVDEAPITLVDSDDEDGIGEVTAAVEDQIEDESVDE